MKYYELRSSTRLTYLRRIGLAKIGCGWPVCSINQLGGNRMATLLHADAAARPLASDNVTKYAGNGRKLPTVAAIAGLTLVVAARMVITLVFAPLIVTAWVAVGIDRLRRGARAN